MRRSLAKCIVMACEVMAYTVTAYTIMASVVVAYTVLAYIVMAYTGDGGFDEEEARRESRKGIGMSCIVMALYSYGVYTYDLYV